MSTQNVQIQLTPKQEVLFSKLNDQTTTVILYGGAARGGKSYGMCLHAVWSAINFPDTRYALCRKNLKNLRTSTLATLFKVLDDCKIQENVHYTFNKNEGILYFKNKSRILLVALEEGERNENFEAIGGLELTHAYIDESSEISRNSFEKLIVRTDNWNNKKFNLKGKLCMASNPSNTSWLYTDIFIPYEKGTLDEGWCYIHAVADDNPFLTEGALEKLSRKFLSEADYQLRRLGNWHYTRSSDVIFKPEKITDAFIRSPFDVNRNGQWLTCDIGRVDKTVCVHWKGMCVHRIHVWEGLERPEIETRIRSILREHKIPVNHLVLDATSDEHMAQRLKGCIAHRGNDRPLRKENYMKLRDQVFYHLAKAFDEGTIAFEDGTYQEQITKELGVIKMYQMDHNKPAQVTLKKDVRKALSASSDFADALSLRMHGEIKSKDIRIKILK